MSYSAIADVGLTLVDLLTTEMEAVFEDFPIPVGLASPASAKELRLSLFLYSILEVPETKNQPEISEGNNSLRRAPLTLDLYYLLTAYPAAEPKPDEPDAEKLLGLAMRILYDNGVVTGTRMLGSLKREDELYITLNPITIEDMTRIWSVFPDKPFQPSVSYLVTPARIESAKADPVSRVIHRQFDVDHLVPVRTM